MDMPQQRRWKACLAAAAGMAAAALVVSLQGCGPTAPSPPSCENGAETGANCKEQGCCKDSKLKCYEKDMSWASCMASCEPGLHMTDPEEYRTEWSCKEVSPPKPTSPPPKGWIRGTWTTGYWDCCKPSCSWAGKGKVNKPVRSCDVRTGKPTEDIDLKSVCAGGHAATCPDQIPFRVNSGKSMAFAAAATGKNKEGLSGDLNCGMCYELKFTDQRHHGPWGGSNPEIVGKVLIIQVTNIGYDVTGHHSFDIMIPGAGQGAFDSGCAKQFNGCVKQSKGPDEKEYKTDDFDCGKRYGGCDNKTGCEALPTELQAGCHWRYDWYDWLKKEGQTNNPYVDFRRVKCPNQLTELSGTVPDDDDEQEIVM